MGPADSEFRLEQVHRFDFLPELQCMSVVATNNFDGGRVLYLKGSPEKVADVCVPASVPANYFDVLSHYTAKGKRVIALASRPLADGEELGRQPDRGMFEAGLRFAGFLVLSNKLKPETTPSIDRLNKGRRILTFRQGDVDHVHGRQPADGAGRGPDVRDHDLQRLLRRRLSQEHPRHRMEDP